MLNGRRQTFPNHRRDFPVAFHRGHSSLGIGHIVTVDMDFGYAKCFDQLRDDQLQVCPVVAKIPYDVRNIVRTQFIKSSREQYVRKYVLREPYYLFAVIAETISSLV